jgi:hypothetical protein
LTWARDAAVGAHEFQARQGRQRIALVGRQLLEQGDDPALPRVGHGMSRQCGLEDQAIGEY